MYPDGTRRFVKRLKAYRFPIYSIVRAISSSEIGSKSLKLA